MSLKDNIDAVKKELSTEEQFLEGVVRAEGFWKKYKKLVISIGVLLVLLALGAALYNMMKEKSLNEANQAYLTLQQNPTDAKALESLKSTNPKLYELFLFSSTLKDGDTSKLDSISSSISDPILKDLLGYQKASQSEKGLGSYITKQDSVLKEFAILQEVYTNFKNGKSKEAKALLGQIPKTSQLYTIANSFNHYIK